MPLRILVLNERDLNNPLAGGAEVHLFENFERLVAGGNDVTLLAATFEGGRKEEMVRGVRVKRLVNRYLYPFAVPFAARREAASGRYDIVIDALNKLPMLSPWFVRLPCLAIVHHLFGITAFRQVSPPIALVTYLAEKLIPYAYRRTVLVAISPSTRDDLAARGITPDNVVIIPPGLSLEVYKPAADAKPDVPLIVWLNRVEHYKRGDTLIDAMPAVLKSVPEARLVFVGDGNALASLRAQATRMGLNNSIEFAGFVDTADKVRLLQQAQVLVNTSEKEGWGLTVMEGNACGTPTVASNAPGLRDSVRDGTTGILVPHADPQELAAALIRVLENPELRMTFEDNAIEWARRFEWNALTNDLLQIMQQVAAGHEPPFKLKSSPFEDA